MKLGIILQWVERIDTRSGTVEGSKTESFVAREILVIWSILSTMLDELHAKEVSLSATVERSVLRHLVL